MCLGAPGAGKTSLAGPLAAALGCALTTKDVIKEARHDALGAPEPDLAWSRRPVRFALLAVIR